MRIPLRFICSVALISVSAVGQGCQRDNARTGSPQSPDRMATHSDMKAQDGPADGAGAPPPKMGDKNAGKDVFRFETFGNEGFFTDAMRMPKGMADEKVTPLDALKAGLSVDIDALPADLKETLAKELKTDMSPANAPTLNDPNATVKLIEANAVPGLIPKGKDRVGVSCALCHTITDHSVFDMPHGGSIGHRIDGPTPYNLNMGKLLAIAANSRAYFPSLQLEQDGKTIGRAPKGLTADSTEAEVDAYLSNPKYFPIGTFDDTQDGNGNSITIQPLFRQDLAGPFGSAGEVPDLENFSNHVYTRLFDPTNLLSPEGRKFLHAQAGKLGDKLADDYEKVLKATGVTGYPYVKAAKMGAGGEPKTPVGLRVDDKKLLDMSAYLVSLPAPKGAKVDEAAFQRGRELFRSNCTSCHNVDQSKPVPAMLVDLSKVWPDYKPEVILTREPPLDAIQNSPGTFDDKMVVVDASDHGLKRGNALPLLLDLARKPRFLHDASVNGLDSLLDPARGAKSPHPFYFAEAVQRSDVVQFLKGLDTDRK